MDFLEGALLGRYWSDTDFETRRHRGLELILSASFWGLMLLGAYTLNFRRLPGLLRQGRPWIALFALLFLLTPLVGKFYYRWPVPARLLALGVLFLKYVSLYLGIITAAIPLMRLPEDFALMTVMEFFESTLGAYLENTQNATELVINIALIILVGGILVIVGGYILIQLPVWLYRFTSWVQRTYDEAVDMYLHHRLERPTQHGHGIKDRLRKLWARVRARSESQEDEEVPDA